MWIATSSSSRSSAKAEAEGREEMASQRLQRMCNLQKRHMKCDELKPRCSNCQKLSLNCGGYEQKLVFKIYNTSLSSPTSRSISHSSATNPDPEHSHCDAVSNGPRNDDTHIPESAHSPESEVSTKVISHCFLDRKQPSSTASRLICPETGYYSHFLGTVSSILLVWDAPYNSNPYRFSLPHLAHSLWTLTESMKALGALHLANISGGEDRRRHLQSAMIMYGKIISAVRKLSTTPSSKMGLPDFATSLLLCLFEMMDSRTDGWKVHLLGASNIYKLLFGPNSLAGDIAAYDDEGDLESTHPVRRFLVSLLAYLDIAGSYTTGTKTLVSGDYWESHGGSWEYNLGVPSFSHNLNDNVTLGQILQSWSRLMSIQADISNFAEMNKQGMSKGRHEMTRHDLESRLTRWRLNALSCFALFTAKEIDVDSDEEWYLKEAMGFIEAYEKATIIYLHKVCTTGQIRPAATASEIQVAVQRILVLAGKLCTGVVQLGMPWALFMAGTELISTSEQDFVRQKFVDMVRFGMMNIQKALGALEDVWLERQRKFEGCTYLPDFQSAILLP